MAGTHNGNTLQSDPQSEDATQDEEILTGKDDIAPDDGAEPSGPDKIGLINYWPYNLIYMKD